MENKATTTKTNKQTNKQKKQKRKPKKFFHMKTNDQHSSHAQESNKEWSGGETYR